MTERERLIELLKEHCVLRPDVLDCTNRKADDCPECLADYLLANNVNFVEVVRCNQCRYCNPIICSSAYGCAHPDGLEHIKDRYKNYCSYGERRTEE